MSRAYETTIIFNAHLSQEQLDANVEKYLQIIQKEDGDIKLVDRWGKRRLAYEIAKKQYGYYVYIRFNAPGTAVQAMERDFKLDETILRHLTVLVPKVVQKDEVFKPLNMDREDDGEETTKETAATETESAEDTADAQ